MFIGFKPRIMSIYVKNNSCEIYARELNILQILYFTINLVQIATLLALFSQGYDIKVAP